MKYQVLIEEIASTVVEVEASNENEAREVVERAYWKNPQEYQLEPYEITIEVV